MSLSGTANALDINRERGRVSAVVQVATIGIPGAAESVFGVVLAALVVTLPELARTAAVLLLLLALDLLPDE
jgi:hypothetical protein